MDDATPYHRCHRYRSKALHKLRRSKQLVAIAAMPVVAKDIAAALGQGRFTTAWRMACTATRSPDLGAEKIVSRKHRYIWLCVPKAAGRSIIAALRRVTPDAELFVGQSIADIFSQRPEVQDYYSFAFVRHPFARALSLYCELHFSHLRYTDDMQRRHKKEKRRRFFYRMHGLAEATSFDDYCQWLHTPYASDAVADRHILSQHLQLRLNDGRLPDFIGHFENLDADLQRVAEHLGLPKPALPLLNTMADWQATPTAMQAARSTANAILTQSSKALLATRYATDLELGDYTAT